MNRTLSPATVVTSYIVLTIGALVALFPFALTVMNALKTATEIVANPLALPNSPQLLPWTCSAACAPNRPSLKQFF